MTEILKSPAFWVITTVFIFLIVACGVYLWWWISEKCTRRQKVFRICVAVMILSVALRLGIRILDNVFTLDRSARVENEILIWNGAEYLHASGYYNLNGRVAMTEDSENVYKVKGDKDLSFVVLESSYGNVLYAKKGVSVDSDGDITQIALDGAKHKNKELLKVIESIRASFITSYVYSDSEIWFTTEDKELDALCIYYDDCPVGIRTHDYVGKLNGQVVYARRQDNDTAFTYDIFVLDDETSRIINEHF